MANDCSVHGIWKVNSVYACEPASTNELPDFVGVSFKLDESGDVSWTVPDGIEPMSFCNCESFEVHQVDSSKFTLKLFGMYPDHTFQFEVLVSADRMKMTVEDSYIFDCQRVEPSYGEDTEPYSLLNALGEPHFSDMCIVSASGKEFHVHRAVFALTQPDDRSTNVVRLLHGQSDSVVATVLHYFYTECLPIGLSEDTASACMKAVGSVESLRDFVQLCNSFLQNTTLKQQIMQLINEMDQCVDRIIGIMSGKVTDTSNRRAPQDGYDGGQAMFGDILAANPSRLWYAATLICRELVVASGKFLVLCDLFARRRSELPREERHNIMRACHECIPKFLSRLKRFLEVCQHQFSSISASQRHDIAAYIVPETEGALDLIAVYVKDLSALLDYVIKSSDRSDKADSRTAVAEIGRVLKNALHVRELSRLKKLYEKAMEGLQTLGKHRSSFSKMTHEQKIQMMNKSLEKIIDKIPAAIARIDSFIDVVDERISWKGWKYIFKMGSSKVAFVLNKMQLHRREMRPLIDRLVEDVQRDPFRESLVMLGLEDNEQQPQSSDEASASSASGSVRKSHVANTFTGEPVVTKYARLSAVESLCKSPNPANSRLSRAAGVLLTSAYLADMVFDVQDVDAEAASEVGASAAEAVAAVPRKSCRISAHRVILASRCTWFKRALLSGMKESIDRVITVHDTDAKTFRLFLQYAYTGIVSLSDLSLSEIADLVQLADRYEMDSLKCVCEKALEQNIEEGTALYLLSLADQCQVLTLKKTVLEYIALHPTITQSEDFCSLASGLQSEVFDTISSLPPSSNFVDSSASSEADVDEMIDKLEQFGERYSVSDDELAQPDDSVQLAQCVSELRIVLGANPSQEMLVQISRAADYDANRALNFYFANSSL